MGKHLEAGPGTESGVSPVARRASRVAMALPRKFWGSIGAAPVGWRWLTALLLLAHPAYAGPMRLHVAPDGTHQPPFATWEQAATNIQAAVDAAADRPGAVIQLAPGIYHGSGHAAVVTITTPLSLRGAGKDRSEVVIDGQGARRAILAVLTEEGADLAIEGLTVRNGCTVREHNPPSGADLHGAGVYLQHTAIASGTARIRDCRFEHNVNAGPHGHNTGGGLASRGAVGSGFHTHVADSIFAHNIASNRSGYGAGAAFLNTRLTVDRCRFEGNLSVGENPDSFGHVRPGKGGGVSVRNVTDGSVIRETVFVVNRCEWGNSRGGGLLVEGDDTDLLVEHCRFEDNVAAHATAVSLVGTGALTLRHSQLLGHDAEVFRRWSDNAVCVIDTCVIEGRVWTGGNTRFAATDTLKDPAVLLADDGTPQPVQTLEQWTARRAKILRRIERAAGPLPDMGVFPAPEIAVLRDDVIEDGLRRQLIEYYTDSTAHPRVKAWLFSPMETSVMETEPSEGRRPAVLCLHQTNRTIGKNEPAGLGGDSELFYALELARRGFVTLAPDFSGSGEHPGWSSYESGYVSGTMKGIADHIRAVDLLVATPGVDPDRIGVIGHSLGGFNALMVAVFEPRLKAVVTSCGYVNWQAYADREGSIYLMGGANYMPRLARHYASHPGLAPFDWHEVIAALAPRPVFVNAPLRDDPFLVEGVHETLEAARPIYALHGAQVAIEAVHPDTGHSFPSDVREQAYAFLERSLGVEKGLGK